MENPLTAAAAEQLLTGLPGFAGALIEARLSDGPTNASFRALRGNRRYVLRLDKPAAVELGLDRYAEQAVSETVAAAGIGPETVLADPERGVFLRRFLEGRSWRRPDLDEPEHLHRLAEVLGILHSLPPAGNAFEPAAAARRYADRLGSPQALALSKVVTDRQRQIGIHSPPARLCHNDLVCQNVVAGEKLWLIDWEYAGIGDPFFDLAVVIQHHGLTEDRASNFFTAYLGRKAGSGEKTRLGLQRQLYQALLQLWQLRTER
jgi:thiamine kinase-like enzyme